MPPPRKKVGNKKPFRPGCKHCHVWFAEGTEFVIACPHCFTKFSRLEELVGDAKWCAGQAADSQRSHRRLCERRIRTPRAA